MGRTVLRADATVKVDRFFRTALPVVNWEIPTPGHDADHPRSTRSSRETEPTSSDVEPVQYGSLIALWHPVLDQLLAPHSGIEFPRTMSFVIRRVLAVVVALAAVSSSVTWLTTRDAHDATTHSTVYLALGASDAVGIGAGRPETEGWVPVVHAGLSSRTQLVNLGVSGATLDDVLALEVPVATGAQPSLVTLWPGPNDIRAGVSLPTFAEHLDQILATIRDAGDPDIYVLSLPDLRYVPAFGTAEPDALDALVRDWNRAIIEVADRYGAHVVDLYGASLELDDHPEYLSDDGFHPSTAGFRRIAEIVLDSIDGSAVATH
jgi:acyl-CoA thioesterase I